MRVAALFCGLVAGLFTLLMPMSLGADLQRPFLELWGTSADQQILGAIAWYVPLCTAVLGGLFAFVLPGIGALMLGIAGAAWLGLGVVDSTFLRAELIIPGALSSAGALIAFLAEEFEFGVGRAARRNRGEVVRDSDYSREPRSRPDRDKLPEWPERPLRPLRSESDDKQAVAREEVKAREQAKAREDAKVRAEAEAEAKARAEAFYSEFVNLLDKGAVAMPSGMLEDVLSSSLNFNGDLGAQLAITSTAIEGPLTAGSVQTAGLIHVAVVGAPDSGLPLNPELVALGGTFIGTASTTPHYTLYALPNTTPPKSGLFRSGSSAIAVGVWSLDAAGFGEFVSRISYPFCIGTLSLQDGSRAKGLLIEASAVQGAEDISQFGRWRAPGASTRRQYTAHGHERNIARRVPNVAFEADFVNVLEHATVPLEPIAPIKAGTLDGSSNLLTISR